ncbi:MAG: dihydrolipoyllysine-residue acetyltransferase [Pseudomonadota bacterium]
MSKHTITVPDIGGSDAAEVVEVLVAVGDQVDEEQGLVVLESDKASMEIPSDVSGTVVELLVAEGDALAEGATLAVVETTSDPLPEHHLETASSTVDAEATTQEEQHPPEAASTETVTSGNAELVVPVPDIGTDEAVDLIELEIELGQTVTEGDTLVVLESDKASMDVPAPQAGVIREIFVSAGQQVKEGDNLVRLEVSASTVSKVPADAEPAPESTLPRATADQSSSTTRSSSDPSAETIVQRKQPGAGADSGAASNAGDGSDNYAGPAVRKLAREFGVPLAAVRGTGPRNRVLKEDLHRYVQEALESGPSRSPGVALADIPDVDFAQFGPVDIVDRSRLDKLTATNMQRSWLSVPHVTQFDDADISDLEDFRKSLKDEADRRGTKLTPLPFLLKAAAVALKTNPKINSSLSDGGETLTFKNYVHIGMAVDTPAGLVVPVLRDVDQKSVWEIAKEVFELAEKARERKLKPAEMQGAGFTISSLGAIGGRGFTPIVNTPEVAILGVGRAAIGPVWNGTAFAPRKLLPLALSYDHRVVNGGDAGRFLTELCGILKDMRRAIL